MDRHEEKMAGIVAALCAVPVTDGPAAGELTASDLDDAVARWPWFAPLRVLSEVAGGHADTRLHVVEAWRAESSLRAVKLDVDALTALSSDDLIDRFLREEDLKIVAREDGPDEEVLTEARLDEQDELVSEELAEIYLAQGYRERAIAIYRKLSLLNPEKSVYFAELIGKIEKQ